MPSNTEPQPGVWNPRIVSDILGYSVTAVVLVAVVVTALVHIYANTMVPVSAGVFVGGLFVAFTVTPYVVAWWVGIDIDDLVRIDA